MHIKVEVFFQEFATDIAVCMDSWVGGIRIVHFKLWLATPDGSRCVINEMDARGLENFEEKRDNVCKLIFELFCRKINLQFLIVEIIVIKIEIIKDYHLMFNLLNNLCLNNLFRKTIFPTHRNFILVKVYGDLFIVWRRRNGYNAQKK